MHRLFPEKLVTIITNIGHIAQQPNTIRFAICIRLVDKVRPHPNRKNDHTLAGAPIFAFRVMRVTSQKIGYIHGKIIRVVFSRTIWYREGR